MNLKEAKKLQPGAIIRESWGNAFGRHGLVIGKTHVVEEHTAKMLCHKKSQRYDVVVHWFDGPRTSREAHAANPEVLQNWEIMVISHA